MFLAFVTLLTGPLKLRIFAIYSDKITLGCNLKFGLAFLLLFRVFFIKGKNERILNMFGVTISCDVKLPVCKNYMNFADTVGIYKYQHFGAKTLEISPYLLDLLRK